MFLQSVHFFENNLGQIMKVRIFWTRLVWRKQKCPDFLDKNFFAKMQKSGFFGVRILSKPLYTPMGSKIEKHFEKHVPVRIWRRSLAQSIREGRGSTILLGA